MFLSYFFKASLVFIRSLNTVLVCIRKSIFLLDENCLPAQDLGCSKGIFCFGRCIYYTLLFCPAWIETVPDTFKRNKRKKSTWQVWNRCRAQQWKACQYYPQPFLSSPKTVWVAWTICLSCICNRGAIGFYLTYSRGNFCRKRKQKSNGGTDHR